MMKYMLCRQYAKEKAICPPPAPNKLYPSTASI